MWSAYRQLFPPGGGFNQLNLSATQLIGSGSALEEELKVHNFVQWLNTIILSYLTASLSFCVSDEIYSLELGEALGGQSSSKNERQAEDMRRGFVLGRPRRIPLGHR